MSDFKGVIPVNISEGTDDRDIALILGSDGSTSTATFAFSGTTITLNNGSASTLDISAAANDEVGNIVDWINGVSGFWALAVSARSFLAYEGENNLILGATTTDPRDDTTTYDMTATLDLTTAAFRKSGLPLIWDTDVCDFRTICLGVENLQRMENGNAYPGQASDSRGVHTDIYNRDAGFGQDQEYGVGDYAARMTHFGGIGTYGGGTTTFEYYVCSQTEDLQSVTGLTAAASAANIDFYAGVGNTNNEGLPAGGVVTNQGERIVVRMINSAGAISSSTLRISGEIGKTA